MARQSRDNSTDRATAPGPRPQRCRIGIAADLSTSRGFETNWRYSNVAPGPTAVATALAVPVAIYRRQNRNPDSQFRAPLALLGVRLFLERSSAALFRLAR
jgi:hypothetical protein